MRKMWKNKLELLETFDDRDFQHSFSELFTLRMFVYSSIMEEDYIPPKKLCDSIILTEIGQIAFESLSELFSYFSEKQIKFLVFLLFYHRDLYIDVFKSKIDIIHDEINNEVLKGKMKIPWIYGRTLYNRFYESFPTVTSDLGYEETCKLLEGTEIGVFSLKKIISGPLGLVNGLESRVIMPTKKIKLWHCSDLSCFATHFVTLNSGKTFELGCSTGRNFLTQELGPPSEWRGFYGAIIYPKEIYYDDMKTTLLPILLGEAFSKTELRSILEFLLDRYSKEIRPLLSDILQGPSKEISSRLNQAQCLQLILLAKDHQIVHAVDNLIDDETIFIPSTEVRKIIHTTGLRPGYFRNLIECSKFGVRSYTERPNVRLRRLILLLDSKKGNQMSNLEWNLNFTEGSTFGEKIERYLASKSPNEIIKEQCFKSQEALQKTCDHLLIIGKQKPRTQVEEEKLINRILWKLGFNPRLSPPIYEKFWKSHEKLISIIKSPQNDEQENIRSVAVNFFVNLEHILNQTLSFLTWLLFEDHWKKTQFRFNLPKAQYFMAMKLNEFQKDEDHRIDFDIKGKNTMYSLIHGLTLLSNICDNYLVNNDGILRPINELPGFVGKTEMRHFPFLHKELLGDCQTSDVKFLIKQIREIHSLLAKGDVAGVRNRIEHYREDFPLTQEIQDMCNFSKKAVNILEESGFSPMVYYLDETIKDQFERTTYIYSNYKRRKLKCTPSMAAMIRFDYSPQIMVPSMHLKDSAECLRCRIEEESAYSRYWSDYPLRRNKGANVTLN